MGRRLPLLVSSLYVFFLVWMGANEQVNAAVMNSNKNWSKANVAGGHDEAGAEGDNDGGKEL